LAREALSRLIGEEEPAADELAETHTREEEAIEKPISLAEQRIGAVIAALRSSGAKRVLDLGCGEGRLLRELLKDKAFIEIVGLDVSQRALEIASQKLRLEDLPTMQKDRIRLIHGSLTYRDKRLSGYAPLWHQPIRTPANCGGDNTECRVQRQIRDAARRQGATQRSSLRFKEDSLKGRKTRRILVLDDFHHGVRFLPIGPEDPIFGSPTQMGIFTRG